MREIKFRAWDRTNKIMLIDKDLWIHIYPQKDIKEDSVSNIPDYHIGEQPNDVSYDARTDLEIMQFTGLKDKNGKEIYEGDICQCEDDKVFIEFSDGAYWFMYNKNDGFTYDWAIANSQWSDKDIEVIGNIYENPELLEDIK